MPEQRAAELPLLAGSIAQHSERLELRAPDELARGRVSAFSAPDLWMPNAPAIKVTGGTTVYLAGVTASPVYHHQPHPPEEFDDCPPTWAARLVRRLKT